MKFRKLKSRKLTESAELNFMQLMNRAIARHTGRLNEAYEDDTEGLDEFEDEDADFEDDFDAAADDAELEGDGDMVTIRVPRSVAEELYSASEDAVEGVEGGDAEDLISDEDVAEADANIAADEAADAAMDAEAAADELEDDEEGFDAEEDEEAFAVTNTNASPRRERFTGSYRNEMTVPSIIKGAIAKSGYAKTIADGAPKRTQFTGSYRNEPTVKSRYTPGKTRMLQNTID